MLKIEQVLRNEKGENVLNDYFESINIKGNYIVVKKYGLTGLYNSKNFKKILDCKWEKIVFDRNCIQAHKSYQIAVFDENGNTILECEWDKVVLYDKGIVVTRNNLQGFLNYDGTIILDCVWKRIEPYSNVILAYRGRGAKRLVFDYDGNMKEE